MSIMRQMKDKAVAMAEAMAQRARTPQDIEAVRQRLVADIQGGRMPAYVGVPLIQDLTQRLTKAKAEMAQKVAGMGVPQAPQGAPIAQQVMAQAQQAPAGVESLPSNLPQSYAPGGLVAFEEGGKVERYQNTGLVDTTPAGRFFSGLGQNFSETNEAAKLRNQLQAKYGPASALPGLFMKQTDEQRQQAKQIAQLLPSLSLPQLKLLNEQGPAALPSLMTPTAAAAPTVANPYDPATATRRSMYETAPPPAPSPAAAPGIGALKLPTLQTFTPTPAVLPERDLPTLTDLNAITANMPDRTKKAAEDAVTKTQKTLEDMDRPGFEAREGRLGKRETALEKDTAVGRALNLMSLGFGIAGSKERTLAGALGNEGRQGIRDLIQGEAANRAARDRLEDYRDNLEQQKVAAKKGNYQAAQAAGKDAANDLRSAIQFSLDAAYKGNAQGISMYNTLTQGDVNRATVTNQGQQLQMSAVDAANRNKLSLANLDLEGQKLAQTVAYQNQLLAQNDKKIEASNALTRVRAGQVRANALSKFDTGPGMQLSAQLTAQYGNNWRTAQDPRSLQAQLLYQQARQAYLMDAMGQFDLMDTDARAKPAEDL